MADLRLIIDSSDDVPPTPEALAAVVSEGARMLEFHGITVEADMKPGVEERLDLDGRAFLLSTAREGFVNAFKYARRSTPLSLILDSRGDEKPGFLELTLINETSDEDSSAEAGGFGLHRLARRGAQLGATLDAHLIGRRWVLSARIPFADPPTEPAG